MTRIKMGDVHYNAGAGAFEARVDIHRDGRTFRYPCQVPGPVTMDLMDVRKRLARTAIGMSDSGSDLQSYH